MDPHLEPTIFGDPKLIAVIRSLTAGNAQLAGFVQAHQVRLVVDTNVLVRELRWRSVGRRKPDALSQLSELIVAGTVIAVAPREAVHELREHLPRLAAEWKRPHADLERMAVALVGELRIVECRNHERLGADGKTLSKRDPNDMPFLSAFLSVAAGAVVTHDKDLVHATSVTAPVQVLIDLRTYSRNKSVEVGIAFGGVTCGLVTVATLQLLWRLVSALIDGYQRLPKFAQTLIAIGVGLALNDPRLRTALASGARRLIEVFDKDVAPVVSTFMRMWGDARLAAGDAWDNTKALLPVPPPRTVRQIAFGVCVTAGRPLTRAEIVARMRNEGYSPGRRGADGYLRRVLRSDTRIVKRPDGTYHVPSLGWNA